MYIEDWDSFFQQAEELYRNDPLRTRYCTKYLHKEGKLVVKVTDDKKCLQYKTDQQTDLRRLEKLNILFFALMSKGEVTAEDLEAGSGQQAAPQKPAAGKGAKNRRRG